MDVTQQPQMHPGMRLARPPHPGMPGYDVRGQMAFAQQRLPHGMPAGLSAVQQRMQAVVNGAPGVAQRQPQPGQLQPQPGQMQPQPGQMQPQPGQLQPQPGQMQPQSGELQPPTQHMAKLPP